jgi:hypothetical protein
MIAKVRIARHGATYLVLAPIATDPMDRQIDNFRLPLGMNYHFVDQLPDDFLAVCDRGRRRFPECRNVRGERQDPLAIRGGQILGVRLLETLVFLLGFTLGQQSLFPVPFQFSRYQTILRFHP